MASSSSNSNDNGGGGGTRDGAAAAGGGAADGAACCDHTCALGACGGRGGVPADCWGRVSGTVGGGDDRAAAALVSGGCAVDPVPCAGRGVAVCCGARAVGAGVSGRRLKVNEDDGPAGGCGRAGVGDGWDVGEGTAVGCGRGCTPVDDGGTPWDAAAAAAALRSSDSRASALKTLEQRPQRT
jgi:hypothetical protein